MTESDGAASFRDPLGRLVVSRDRVVRWVRASGRDALEAFVESPTMRAAVARGNAVGTYPVEADEVPALSDLFGPDGDPDPRADPDPGADPDAATREKVPGAAVVTHDRIPFPSHPYEWPPEMLEAAAALTLDLQDGLIGEGLALKDATPYNVLFDGPRPVFVDALSVERRDPHDPGWPPHAQFVRTFLLPLLVARDAGVPLSVSLLAHRDGLRPDQVYTMTPPLRRLRAPYRSLVTLPTWLAGTAEARGASLYAPRRVKDPAQATFIIRAVARRLRKRLRQVRPGKTPSSHWSGYMETRAHYGVADAAQKDAFVRQALDEARPEWVLDVGCNTGHFSVMAAQAGSRVVAIDLDPASVGRLWQRAEAERFDILPLVVDLARPTPAVGWDNREHPSFLERAEGRFDMVFLLAVMHHLHVTERIPIDAILASAKRLTRRHLVFEYVGPEDPMFRGLLRGRAHLHQDLTRARFETLASRDFDILEAVPARDTDRVLYLLRRRDGPETTPAAPAIAAVSEVRP